MRSSDITTAMRWAGRANLYGTMVFALWVWCASLAPASADLPDADSAEFQTALQSWLADDELSALSAFVDLAEGGHVSARLLLGMIEKSAALQGPELAHLPRAERIALLRAPGGTSGSSWMAELADDNRLAALWLGLWYPGGDIDIARGFAELDEPRATRIALLVVSSRHDRGYDYSIRAEDWYPAALQHLTPTRVLSSEMLTEVHEGHPIRRFAGEDTAEADLRAWLLEDELALPLRAACDEKCNGTAADCTVALYHGLGGYHSLLRLGSPIAGLIPDAEFASSARGMGSLARRIMLQRSTRMRDAHQGQLAKLDSCAADWLRAEYQRFSTRARAPASDTASAPD